MNLRAGLSSTHTPPVMKERYEELKAQLLKGQAEGLVPTRLSAEDRADWAYGNAVIENDAVTREMARAAAGVGGDDDR